MEPESFAIEGGICGSGGLQIPRARDFALLVESGASPNAELVECKKCVEGTEAVIVELRSTVPQRPAVPIRRVEKVAVFFRPSDDWYPDVRALRHDFPRDRVMHLNGGIPESEPVSLCLFSETWPDVRLRLTANEFLFRLQGWLNDSADGTLHREDQPLEPAFMARSIPLVVGPEFLERMMAGVETLNLDLIDTPAGMTLIERRNDRFMLQQARPALVLPVVSEPHEHGLMNLAPRNLAELNEQLRPIGIDLLEKVQTKLFALNGQPKALESYGFLVVLILMLRKRNAETEPEPELAAFMCFGPNSKGASGILRDVGFVSSDSFDKNRIGQNTSTFYLKVRYELTPESASNFSGQELIDRKIVAIGGGAIGSQVLLNSVREGIANWTVIDEDVLLPHNLVRHGLPGSWIGHAKATGLEAEANTLLSKPTVKGICADVENPKEAAPALKDAFENADAIVDLSASLAVAKQVANDVTGTAKRASLFISPSGKDLVVLGESGDRKIRLDGVESQYYRAIASDPRLAGHLKGGSTVGSCRDVTSRVPQSLMGLHAAIGTRALREWLQSDVGVAKVVRTNEESLSCEEIEIPLGETVHVGTLAGWKVVTDTELLKVIRAQREAGLPSETGGVLLAQFDAQRKVLYVCHQIPAPSDSKKQPTVYIRGSEGLATEYTRVRDETKGALVYIGEWHSHPENCPCEPSNDDILAGAWLADQTRATSLPGLMLIVGDGDQTCWMLCVGSNEKGSPAHLCLRWGTKENVDG